ncbi:unnamed protein product [Tenebrio molitor]|nr:unnamed protein product [Tenebrio molitor]
MFVSGKETNCYDPLLCEGRIPHWKSRNSALSCRSVTR